MEPFLSFLAVGAVALVVPGPDTLVVLRTALADGPRAGTWVAAGSGAGILVWGTATAAGVAGLLAASGSTFAVVKLAGAAYLALLGLQSLLAALRGTRLAARSAAGDELSRPAAFRRGLASDLLNVKVGLFWTALVPQFVGAHSGAALPAAMVLSMAAMGFVWLTGYAHAAARLHGTLERPGSSRAINATVGVVLVALGAHLAL